MEQPPEKKDGKKRKPHCRYHVRCRNSNFLHLSELCHPQLENLLKDKLHEEVNLQELIPTECKDKSLMLKQLEHVKRALKKELDEEIATPIQPIISSMEKCSTQDVESSGKDSTSPPRPSDKFNFASDELISKSLSKSSEKDDWKKSLCKVYEICEDENDRDKIRDIAVKKLKKSGEIYHERNPDNFQINFEHTKPYYIFFSTVDEAPSTWEQFNSITFSEILNKNFGEIKKSLHVNYKVDVGWLEFQYLLSGQPLDEISVFYGELLDVDPVSSKIDMEYVQSCTKSGLHHSKISVLVYENGARIIIPSGNLYDNDWKKRTQTIWISPHLNYLSEYKDSKSGESKTGFKKDFLNYIKQYKMYKFQKWIDLFLKLDFSSINVFFIYSIPGNYKEKDGEQYGLSKLSQLLSKHVKIPDDEKTWSIVTQTSSLGGFGDNFDAWLGKDVVPAFASDITQDKKSSNDLQLIFPTKKNYESCFERKNLTSCNPYRSDIHEKQKEWLENYLYQWKATSNCRDKAMPHSKCYTRISPDGKKIAWFLLTSANLSKSAWGSYWWGYDSKMKTINNYEAGIVFFPKCLIGKESFLLETTDEIPGFPLLYDVPLTPYEAEDEPFVVDLLATYKSQDDQSSV